MHILRNILLAGGFAAFATTSPAATINGQSTGLVDPDGFVGFGEVEVEGELVTDQFADFGVSFSGGVSLFNGGTERPNFEDPFALNFEFQEQDDGSNRFIVYDPLQIIFTNTVSAASFATTNNNTNSSVFTAFLGDTIVESFTTDVANPTGPGNENNIYGFEGIVFDRIQYDVASGARTFGLDSLSFNVAAVPLPAGLPLMLLGLGSFAMLRRKKSA